MYRAMIPPIFHWFLNGSFAHLRRVISNLDWFLSYALAKVRSSSYLHRQGLTLETGAPGNYRPQKSP